MSNENTSLNEAPFFYRVIQGETVSPLPELMAAGEQILQRSEAVCRARARARSTNVTNVTHPAPLPCSHMQLWRKRREHWHAQDKDLSVTEEIYKL
jgi:hypothetical protein